MAEALVQPHHPTVAGRSAADTTDVVVHSRLGRLSLEVGWSAKALSGVVPSECSKARMRQPSPSDVADPDIGHRRRFQRA